MEREQKGDVEEDLLCDWCGKEEPLGTFFVPGRGVLNLCGHCRVLLMAILIDLA